MSHKPTRELRSQRFDFMAHAAGHIEFHCPSKEPRNSLVQVTNTVGRKTEKHVFQAEHLFNNSLWVLKCAQGMQSRIRKQNQKAIERALLGLLSSVHKVAI